MNNSVWYIVSRWWKLWWGNHRCIHRRCETDKILFKNIGSEVCKHLSVHYIPYLRGWRTHSNSIKSGPYKILKCRDSPRVSVNSNYNLDCRKETPSFSGLNRWPSTFFMLLKCMRIDCRFIRRLSNLADWCSITFLSQAHLSGRCRRPGQKRGQRCHPMLANVKWNDKFISTGGHH